MSSPNLIGDLANIVGARHVLTSEAQTRRYRTGYRFGSGQVLAVVRPGSLVEQWRVLAACLAAHVVVITQASNTGLTGGSTPDGNGYDRDVVIVSTNRIRRVHLLDGGNQVVCIGGTTLDQLEGVLKPLGREPHSVIGSSCIGASVLGGISNNSGGSLVHRGPAYTEMALYAALDASGTLHLVNHLGIGLGNTPEEILSCIEHGAFSEDDVDTDSGAAASDLEYATHVRKVDEPTPARFNADPRRLFEASGSAGKVMTFAVRLDTFAAAKDAKVFYIGTNDVNVLTNIRRHALASFKELPIAGEYLHRDAFDIASRYGKDLFMIIDKLGTNRLPMFFDIKNRSDAWFERFRFLPRHLTDRVLQWISERLPNHLPGRLKAYRDQYEHHLMLKVSAQGLDEARDFLAQHFAEVDGAYFECTDEEGRKAFLHRFAAASAAVRYRAVHHREVEDIVALDIALRRNDRDWLERLPPEIERPIMLKLYYGHFLCHVFHQDYIVAKGNDCIALEHEMLKLLDARGAEYPAEHNVGHLYEAKPQLADFYKKLDPCNCFNPGIGKTSKFAAYRDTST